MTAERRGGEVELELGLELRLGLGLGLGLRVRVGGWDRGLGVMSFGRGAPWWPRPGSVRTRQCQWCARRRRNAAAAHMHTRWWRRRGGRGREGASAATRAALKARRPPSPRGARQHVHVHVRNVHVLYVHVARGAGRAGCAPRRTSRSRAGGRGAPCRAAG